MKAELGDLNDNKERGRSEIPMEGVFIAFSVCSDMTRALSFQFKFFLKRKNVIMKR